MASRKVSTVSPKGSDGERLKRECTLLPSRFANAPDLQMEKLRLRRIQGQDQGHKVTLRKCLA